MTGFSHGPDLDATLAPLLPVLRSTGWSDDGPHRLEGPHSLEIHCTSTTAAGGERIRISPGSALVPAILVEHARGCPDEERSETVRLALTTAAYEGASGDPPHLWLSTGAHGLPVLQDALVASLHRPESIPLPLRWDAIRLGVSAGPAADAWPSAWERLAFLVPPVMALDASYWLQLERAMVFDGALPRFDRETIRQARARRPSLRIRPLAVRRLLKLLQDPRGYMLDSRWGLLRWLAQT